MQVQVNIEFGQLLKIINALPPIQLKQLKEEIEKKTRSEQSTIDLETLLLNGPTATDEDIKIIENNRKSINQWRTKQ